MNKCHVCKRAKCKWVDVKISSAVTIERLEEIINHNLSYINMVFGGHQGSVYAEERMYDQLSPYQIELEKRKK